MVTQAGAGTATRLRPRNNWPIERWAGSPSASAACSSAVARYRPNSHCNRPSASARHHPSIVRSSHPPGMPSPVERRASSASVPVADSSNSSTPAAAPGRSQANTRTNGAAESFGGRTAYGGLANRRPAQPRALRRRALHASTAPRRAPARRRPRPTARHPEPLRARAPAAVGHPPARRPCRRLPTGTRDHQRGRSRRTGAARRLTPIVTPLWPGGPCRSRPLP